MISNTNFQEAIDFIDLKASFQLLILLPFILLFIITLKYTPKYSRSKSKAYVIGIILIFSINFTANNILHKRLIRKGVPQIVKLTCSFINQIQSYKDDLAVVTPIELKVKLNSNIKNQCFVLIIGESCNKNHMSLYGYPKNTSPKLKNRQDLMIYSNVVSAYSNTINSILSMLSETNLENKISPEKSIDLIDIFHSACFKTYWISNQSPMGIWDNKVTQFAKKSDYLKFVNITSNSSFEATLNTSLDSKLFKPFVSVLKENTDKKFIVLHLMGSHSSYSKRYPPNFNIFNGGNKKEKTIAEYDNSLVYNDFIVDSLISILSNYFKNDKLGTLIYLSDHGENVYDEQNKVGHDYSNELPKANIEIPYIVWLSPLFIKAYPNKTISIKSNLDKPFVTDDLFHSILDLNKLQCDFFEEKRSVFSQNFNTQRQRILEDHRNYDNK